MTKTEQEVLDYIDRLNKDWTGDIKPVQPDNWDDDRQVWSRAIAQQRLKETK